MKEDKHRGSLGSKFEGFGAAPSAGLWDSIADSLDGKKKRRGIIWWWTGSGMAAVGLISILVFNWNGTTNQLGNDQTNPLASKEKARDWGLAVNHSTDLNASGVQDVLAEEQAEIPVDNHKNALANAGNQTGSGDEIAVENGQGINENKTEADEIINRADVMKDHENEEELVLEEKEQNQPEISDDPMNLLPINSPSLLDLLGNRPLLAKIESTPNRTSNWEIGLGLSSWRASRTVVNAPINMNETFDETDTSDGGTISISAENVEANDVGTVISRPIGFKFHAAYQYSSRFRLTTGLLLEQTRYKRKGDLTDSGQAFAEADVLYNYHPNSVRVSSIGVPIGIEYDFLKKRRFRMGAGVGLINEIPVMESYLPTYDVNFVGKKGYVRNGIIGYNLASELNLNVSYYLTERWRIQGNYGARLYLVERSNSELSLPRRNLFLGGSLNLIVDL